MRARIVWSVFMVALVLGTMASVSTPVQASDLTLSKSFVPPTTNTYYVGDTIYYEIIVQNPADNVRTNRLTRIWDTLPNGTVVEFLGPDETLVQVPGESASFEISYVVHEGDIVWDPRLSSWVVENTCAVEGDDSAGDHIYGFVLLSAIVIRSDINYDLTISGTDGGLVTQPGEGTYTYEYGTVVDLVAVPDTGHDFANWTGDVGTIDNVNSASTTVTLNGDYSITANFEPIAGVQTQCVESETGTGEVCLTTSAGYIEDLTAIPAYSLPSVTFPHGMFSFKITGLTPGQTVTLTIELPAPVPVGTVWWKYDNGRWHSLPNLDDNGNSTMKIRLTDGGTGDMDSIPGQITDPGGPGNPMTVGWEGSPVSGVAVLAPWITLLAAILAGAGLLMLRRRNRGQDYI